MPAVGDSYDPRWAAGITAFMRSEWERGLSPPPSSSVAAMVGALLGGGKMEGISAKAATVEVAGAAGEVYERRNAASPWRTSSRKKGAASEMPPLQPAASSPSPSASTPASSSVKKRITSASVTPPVPATHSRNSAAHARLLAAKLLKL